MDTELQVAYMYEDGTGEETTVPMLLGGWTPGARCGTPGKIALGGVQYIREDLVGEERDNVIGL